MSHQQYYHRRPALRQRARCLLRLLLFIGHDFEVQYTSRMTTVTFGRKQMPMPTGEIAEVCRLCFLVSDRREWRGFPPEISYGSSPGAGRILERRQVEVMPCPA